jgi:isoleucyl-tRNA synthetase
LRFLQAANATEIAKACEANETIAIEGFKLKPDEVIVERVALDNYAVATDAGYAGAVLTVVSNELKAEGTAREIVRVIQNLRKNSGLEISDRINLWIMCSEEVTESLQAHSHYIAAETLAETLELGAILSDDALGSATTEIINIDENIKISVILEKA